MRQKPENELQQRLEELEARYQARVQEVSALRAQIVDAQTELHRSQTKAVTLQDSESHSDLYYW